MFQDQVLPLLQNSRRTIPEERMMEDDDVVLLSERLFPSHVDVKLGIRLIQIVYGDAFDIRESNPDTGVDARLLEGRMSKEDKDAFHGGAELGV